MDALTGLGRQTDARDGLMGRMFKIQKKSRVFKIEISMVSSSTLAAEICAGPHNRLLRRQHCSSLCSQSEGHEHVANMASALGHDFVGFLAVYSRHNIRGPHFASKVSYSASPQPSPNVRAAPLVAMSLRYLTKNIAEFL